MKKGRITPNGVVLKSHEMATVVFLTELGLDVELVPKSNREGAKSPDVKIEGLFWEMKSPEGCGKYLIQNTMHRAARQSENVIMDLRRIKLHQNRCLAEIEKQFKDLKRLKRVKIITKTKKVIDFAK